MNDPLIARFVDACAATAPLDLRVGVADGGVLAEGSLHQPFTLIGSDDSCDVTLSDPDVNPRHVWLQVIAGRVFALDLGSRTGLVWPDGGNRSDWLDEGTPLWVGPFRVQLRSPVSARPTAGGADPLHTDPTLARTCPAVQLDFRNGKRAKDRWAINRAVTLIGRADGCKLHLYADDVAAYHCGLVLTPAGLWVVDLSGRGVVVNGERMRVAPLGHGAELWVGRFLIGCHYPAPGARPGQFTPPAIPGARRTPPVIAPPPTTAAGPPTRVTDILPLFAEDEVQLGGLPLHDPAAGLPSSHIMRDAFQVPTPSGPLSTPIFVGGAASGPTPANAPVPAGCANADPPAPPPSAPPGARPVDPGDEAGIGPLVRQLSEIHGQMFGQFQQSLALMAQMLRQMETGQKETVEQELARIRELSGELANIQAEFTRLALSQALGDGPAATPEPARKPAGDPVTPLPGRRAGASSEMVQAWFQERIDAIRREQKNRWAKLTGLFSTDDTAI